MPRLGGPWATGLTPSIKGMLIEFLFFFLIIPNGIIHAFVWRIYM